MKSTLSIYQESSVIASQREKLFTIQFGSLEPIKVPLIVQGWWWRPILHRLRTKKDRYLSLDRGQGSQNKLRHHPSSKKRQGRTNPRCVKSKKKSKPNKRLEIQPVDLLEQEPLVPVTLDEEKQEKALKDDDKTLTNCQNRYVNILSLPCNTQSFMLTMSKMLVI